MRYRFRGLIWIFFFSFAVLHTTAAQESKEGNGATAANTVSQSLPSSDVAPDAAVMTIHGLCGYTSIPGSTEDGKSRSTSPAVSSEATTPDPKCETIITRQQFENLLHSVSPKGDPRAARSFANNYEDILVFSRKAIETGLDKDPIWQSLLQFKYQQALYSIFKASVKQKANQTSDAQLEEFYNANRPRFEEFKILRIFVPKVKEHPPSSGSTHLPKVDVAAEEEEMKALAKRIRAEAVAGGDFDRLQAKASKLSGSTDDPPETDLGEWTRDALPADSADVIIALKPGQISQPIQAGDGWQIVKLVSRRQVPWGSEARERTLQLIVGDQANGIRKGIHTDLNDQYFFSPGAGGNGAPAN